MDNITPESIIKAAVRYGWADNEPEAPCIWIIETYIQVVVREGRSDQYLYEAYEEAKAYMNAIYVIMLETQIYVEVQQTNKVH